MQEVKKIQNTEYRLRSTEDWPIYDLVGNWKIPQDRKTDLATHVFKEGNISDQGNYMYRHIRGGRLIDSYYCTKV